MGDVLLGRPGWGRGERIAGMASIVLARRPASQG
jgi:hypothetical protein